MRRTGSEEIDSSTPISTDRPTADPLHHAVGAGREPDRERAVRGGGRGPRDPAGAVPGHDRVARNPNIGRLVPAAATAGSRPSGRTMRPCIARSGRAWTGAGGRCGRRRLSVSGDVFELATAEVARSAVPGLAPGVLRTTAGTPCPRVHPACSGGRKRWSGRACGNELGGSLVCSCVDALAAEVEQLATKRSATADAAARPRIRVFPSSSGRGVHPNERRSTCHPTRQRESHASNCECARSVAARCGEDPLYRARASVQSNRQAGQGGWNEPGQVRASLSGTIFGIRASRQMIDASVALVCLLLLAFGGMAAADITQSGGVASSVPSAVSSSPPDQTLYVQEGAAARSVARARSPRQACS